MKRSTILGTSVGCALFVASGADAAPKLRAQVDQRGDFALIGNTLGHDCRAGVPAPIVGSVGACGSNVGDSSPDVFWRSHQPGAGQAAASSSIALGEERSTAILSLPAGATVSHAWLYWAARRSGNSADTSATLERPGGFNQSVTAVDSYTAPAGGGEVHYQSVADVTPLVQSAGPGAYRLSGVDSLSLPNLDQNVAFTGWYLVVFYELSSEPPRNLALFDGLDLVDGSTSQTATLSGFLVPQAGFDAKLGVVTFEGDFDVTGDALRFGVAPLGNADRLFDAQNPIDNFFNGTRSRLASPVSVAGDLPRLTGTAGSMSSLDFDVVNITPRVSPGQTSADIEATSSGDVFLLGAFVTSISTFQPDFSTSTKSVVDQNGGGALPGDVFEYTIVVENTGNDSSMNTVLTDPLPAGVIYVPGSIQIAQGPNAGAKTDASGDDQAQYAAATDTLTVRLGVGANATQGGTLAPGASTTVKFEVTLEPSAPATISNQATIESSGQMGAPPSTTPTDGNAATPGTQPTEIERDPTDPSDDASGAGGSSGQGGTSGAAANAGSTAAGGTSASGGISGLDDEGALQGGGCSCSAPSSPETNAELLLLLAGLCALARRQRHGR